MRDVPHQQVDAYLHGRAGEQVELRSGVRLEFGQERQTIGSVPGDVDGRRRRLVGVVEVHLGVHGGVLDQYGFDEGVGAAGYARLALRTFAQA